MLDQKIAEFRELAELGITPGDPDLLLQRGAALRRRRQVMPAVAVAACVAIGFGIVTSGGDTTDTDQQPADSPTVTTPPDTQSQLPNDIADALEPGSYGLYQLDAPDGRPDATVDLVGQGWQGWYSGAHIVSVEGTVSWGLARYERTIVDRCRAERHATSLSGAVDQLSRIDGSVTSPARPAGKLGLTGTYLQLSVPSEVTCPRREATHANLMAIWDGTKDPTVIVDVWLLEDGDRLLILTRGVRGNPSPDMLESLDLTLDTVRLVPLQ